MRSSDANLMLWLKLRQTGDFDGPELAVNASVQPQTKTGGQLTLWRALPGAQLTSASGVCRQRASPHRGWKKVLSLLMEWDPNDASRGTRLSFSPGLASCWASGGVQSSVGSIEV